MNFLTGVDMTEKEIKDILDGRGDKSDSLFTSMQLFYLFIFYYYFIFKMLIFIVQNWIN